MMCMRFGFCQEASMRRRAFMTLLGGAAACSVKPHTGWTQTFPARPLRMVVGFPAGSAPDVVARVVAPALSERIGQQCVVENRPGAGSNIAAESVVRAPADGYTLL